MPMTPQTIEGERVQAFVDSAIRLKEKGTTRTVILMAQTIARHCLNEQLDSDEQLKLTASSTDRVKGETLAKLGIMLGDDIKVEYRDLDRLVQRNLLLHLNKLFQLEFSASLTKPDRALLGNWSTFDTRPDPVPFFDLEANDRASELIKTCLQDLTNDFPRERELLRERIL